MRRWCQATIVTALLLVGSVIAAGCQGGTVAPSQAVQTTAGAETSSTVLVVTNTTTSPATTIAPETTTTAPTTTTALAPDYIKWGQPGSYDDNGSRYEVTLHEPEDVPDADYGMDNATANRLVAMLVEVSNTGSAPVDINPGWFSLQDGEGFVYEKAYTDQKDKPELRAMTINAGQKVKGYILFEIPEDAEVGAGLCDPNGGFPGGQLIWAK